MFYRNLGGTCAIQNPEKTSFPIRPKDQLPWPNRTQSASLLDGSNYTERPITPKLPSPLR